MELARKRQMKVVERTIMPTELSGFTECFIVGTAAEVTPVAEIGEHKFKPGAVTETLLTDYMKAVQPSTARLAKAG
jgi:branched-chain amino acid aminotransferase